MIRITPQLTATVPVPESLRSACKSLILGVSGGLCKTGTNELSTALSTVASERFPSENSLTLQIHSSHRHLQLNARARSGTPTAVPVLFRSISSSEVTRS